MSNRLIEESSPYLQMHAHNPVDWYPWGTEAFERAKKENKLLIVSIGYAACHWCHVMENESFTDPAVAEIMNKNFIAIKVDREERPDVDEIYMSAIQLIGGRGGWPLNAFALPDGRPLYAVTYLPALQWKDLLLKLKEFYSRDSGKAEEQAAQIQDAMRTSEFTAPEYMQTNWPRDIFDEIFERWLPYMDIERGGYLNAPKFPLPVSWEYFLEYYNRNKNDRVFKPVNTTLDNIARGGIFDQIGGGFSRYSVDIDWKVPHFEKMLYDNAQLVSLYSHAYQVTGNEVYSNIVLQTMSFISRELLSESGAFYTSLDADSEGAEGTYYCWTSEQFDSVLGENSRLMKDYYSVSNEGNWELGKNTLFTTLNHVGFAEKNSLSASKWLEIYNNSKDLLLNSRTKRVSPPLDDKILTSWNALMLKACIDAYLAIGEKSYLDLALANARYLQKNAFLPDGRILRNLKKGKSNISGFLDDYAYIADAWLSVYRATSDRTWLDEAVQIISKVIELFEEEGTGLFFYTPSDQNQFSFRKKIIQDNVLPSPSAVMAKVMLISGTYLSNPDLLERSAKLSRTMMQGLVTGGPYMAGWSSVIQLHAFGLREIRLFGPKVYLWKTELLRHYLPNVLIMDENLGSIPEINIASNRQDSNFAVVCTCGTCGLPLYTLEELLNSINN